MSKKDMTVVQPLTERVKSANPMRGSRYREAAVDFVKRFPIGSAMTWRQFSSWAYDIGALDKLPSALEEEDKRSDAWLAHLQRRHQVLQDLQKASIHPNMIPYGGAFALSRKGNTLFVKEATIAIAEHDAAKKLRSLANTKLRQLDYLVQSVDWAQMPPYERIVAEALREDIEGFVELVHLQAGRLNKKFSNFRHRLDAMVKLGQVQQQNGGIAGLLSHNDDDELEDWEL